MSVLAAFASIGASLVLGSVQDEMDARSRKIHDGLVTRHRLTSTQVNALSDANKGHPIKGKNVIDALFRKKLLDQGPRRGDPIVLSPLGKQVASNLRPDLV